MAGNITLAQRGTGGNLVNYREYTYDDLDQLLSKKHYNSSGTLTKTVTYVYNDYVNILSRTVNGDIALKIQTSKRKGTLP